MSTEQLNQVLISKDEENVPLSILLPNIKKKKQMKRKKDSSEEMPVKKKRELESDLKDYPQPIGELVKFTGEGVNKKCHYEKFEFHGTNYGLEDTVVLIPVGANQKPYVAIIKDIYKQAEEGCVKLQVQWFYRPEEVDKKYVRTWNSNDSRELLYSFHRDEVSAESVTNSCRVYFMPEGKQIPNRGEHPDFIVKQFYDCVKKKLWKLSNNNFNEQQKQDVNLLVAKTISLAGDLLVDIEKKKKTLELRQRKQSAPKRFIKEAEGRITKGKNISNSLDSIFEKFDALSGNSELDDQIKKSKMAFERFLEGRLKPGKMTSDEPRNGLSFDEGTADNEEPIGKIDDASASKSVKD